MQRIFQDWHQWLKDGLIDLGLPMNYASETDARVRGWFDGWMRWEKHHSHGRQLARWPGRVSQYPCRDAATGGPGARATIAAGVSSGCRSSPTPSRRFRPASNRAPTSRRHPVTGSDRLAFLSGRCRRRERRLRAARPCPANAMDRQRRKPAGSRDSFRPATQPATTRLKSGSSASGSGRSATPPACEPTRTGTSGSPKSSPGDTRSSGGEELGAQSLVQVSGSARRRLCTRVPDSALALSSTPGSSQPAREAAMRSRRRRRGSSRAPPPARSCACPFSRRRFHGGCPRRIDAIAARQLVEIRTGDSRRRRPGDPRLLLRVELRQADRDRRLDLVLRQILARLQPQDVDAARDLGAVDGRCTSRRTSDPR